MIKNPCPHPLIHSPALSHIVAMTERGVIGRGGKIPWHLPSDLRFFRKMTLGKAVIMGHGTFRSIGRPLGGRLSIILTRDADLSLEGVICATSLGEALEVARVFSLERGFGEIMVAGGGEIFELTLPLADRIHLVLIKDGAVVEGDCFYPNADRPGLAGLTRTGWREVAVKDQPRVGGEEYDKTYIRLERAKGIGRSL